MCERRISTIALVHKNLQFLPSFKCQDVYYIVGSHNKNKNWSASCPGRNTHGDEHTHSLSHAALSQTISSIRQAGWAPGPNWPNFFHSWFSLPFVSMKAGTDCLPYCGLHLSMCNNTQMKARTKDEARVSVCVFESIWVCVCVCLLVYDEVGGRKWTETWRKAIEGRRLTATLSRLRQP